MAITLNDLSRDVRRLQPESFTDGTFDCRIQMCMGADRAAEFAHANPFPGLRQSLLGPTKFVEHQGQLQPERDRLRVNAVAAANHRRHLESARLRSDCRSQFSQILGENLRGLV